jgi:hypothetical protein
MDETKPAVRKLIEMVHWDAEVFVLTDFPCEQVIIL